MNNSINILRLRSKEINREKLSNEIRKKNQTISKSSSINNKIDDFEKETNEIQFFNSIDDRYVEEEEENEVLEEFCNEDDEEFCNEDDDEVGNESLKNDNNTAGDMDDEKLLNEMNSLALVGGEQFFTLTKTQRSKVHLVINFTDVRNKK